MTSRRSTKPSSTRLIKRRGRGPSASSSTSRPIGLSLWERSALVRVHLENTRVELVGTGGVVSFVAVVTLRAGAGVVESRAPVRAGVQKDADGHLRINYPTLAAAQPALFR